MTNKIKKFIDKLDEWGERNFLMTVTLMIPMTLIIAGLMISKTLVSAIIASILVALCILFIYPSWRHWLFSNFLKENLEEKEK